MRWLFKALIIGLLVLGCTEAHAAEILQVRSGTVLQVGDHNRTYTVELACLSIPVGGEQAATEWLRNSLPRRTKVNLRPMGNNDGTLVARVQRLPSSSREITSDLGDELIAAGLANTQPGC